MKGNENRIDAKELQKKDIIKLKNAIINVLSSSDSVDMIGFQNGLKAIQDHYKTDKNNESQKFSTELGQLTKGLDSSTGLFKDLKLKRVALEFKNGSKSENFLRDVLSSIKDKILSNKKDSALKQTNSNPSLANDSYKYILDKVNEYYPIRLEQSKIQSQVIKREQVQTSAEARFQGVTESAEQAVKTKNMINNLEKSSSLAPQVSIKINNRYTVKTQGTGRQ